MPTAQPAFDATNPDSYYQYAAERLERGVRPDQVADELEDGGLSPEHADEVVEELQRAFADAQRTRGKRNMLFGGLWLFGGLAVTIGTLVANADGKGIVAFGAIIIGAFKFFRGVYQTITA